MGRHLLVRGGIAAQRDVTSNDFFFHLFILVFFAVCQRKKKTITDVLSTSEPKPGCAADLQKTLAHYVSDKRSVIEQEELKLPGESEPFPILTPTFTRYISDMQLHYAGCPLSPHSPPQTPASCPVMT